MIIYMPTFCRNVRINIQYQRVLETIRPLNIRKSLGLDNIPAIVLSTQSNAIMHISNIFSTWIFSVVSGIQSQISTESQTYSRKKVRNSLKLCKVYLFHDLVEQIIGISWRTLRHLVLYYANS